MKSPIYRCVTLLSTLALFFLTGCTRNNGDIGHWFGHWQVMDILHDGKPQEGYAQQYFWEFQNNIIGMVWVAPGGYDRDTYVCYGTWEELSENTMQMDFTHSDDKDTPYYKPFSAMHFPSDRPFTLTITSQSGNNCTMKYTDDVSGVEYTYILRKR